MKNCKRGHEYSPGKGCPTCKHTWHEREPEKHRARVKEYRNANPEKVRKLQKDWAKNNPHKVQEASLRYRYGITTVMFEQMKISQNNSCKICGEQFLYNPRSIHIDHNHETGKVRGLLCGPCNRGLGIFNENSHKLRKAAEYLDNVSK